MSEPTDPVAMNEDESMTDVGTVLDSGLAYRRVPWRELLRRYVSPQPAEVPNVNMAIWHRARSLLAEARDCLVILKTKASTQPELDDLTQDLSDTAEQIKIMTSDFSPLARRLAIYFQILGLRIEAGWRNIAVMVGSELGEPIVLDTSTGLSSCPTAEAAIEELVAKGCFSIFEGRLSPLIDEADAP